MHIDPLGAPAATAQSSGTQYAMTFINNSDNSWNFCCYQKDSGILQSGMLAAGWFVAQVVHPTTSIKFQWTIDYGLSWSQSGVISPGILYFPAQDWPVTAAQNTVTLTKLSGSYTFENQRQQDPATALIIAQDGTIVVSDGIGIGISMEITSAYGGADGLNPIYARGAQPNLTTQFTVTPSYWVVFAPNIYPGQILDVTSLTNTVQIQYGPGVYSMVVTMTAQNQWAVATTEEVNAMYLKAVQSDPGVAWTQVAADVSQLVEAQS